MIFEIISPDSKERHPIRERHSMTFIQKTNDTHKALLNYPRAQTSAVRVAMIRRKVFIKSS